MGRSQLWIARAIRLTGSAMVVGLIALASLAYALSLGYAFPEFWIIVFLSLAFGFLGIPLVFIGDKISPPDPWLDSWLDLLKFHKYVKMRMKSEHLEAAAISASFAVDRPQGQAWTLSAGGKCSVEFEDHHLFLGQPGKDLVLIEPKTIQRTSTFAIQFDTGRWNYGRVTLFFDSVSDADTVEKEAKKLLLKSREVLE